MMRYVVEVVGDIFIWAVGMCLGMRERRGMGSFFGNRVSTFALGLLSAFVTDEDFHEFARANYKCFFIGLENDAFCRPRGARP